MEMEVKSEIRSAIEKKGLVIGTKSVLRGLRKDKISRVVLAKNAPEEIKQRMVHYAEIANVPVDVMSEHSVDLGLLCKKSFSILVLGISK